jgi:hypothetical protein
MNKITHKFQETDHLYFPNFYKGFLYLEDSPMILVNLASLYEKKIITYEKLKGQIKALRNGTLQQRKNTYHCEINNRWYSMEPPKDIFEEIFKEYGLNNVKITTLVEVIQLYLNKNYNYALDWIVTNIYKPNIDSLAHSSFENLNSYLTTSIPFFPEIVQKGYTRSCFYCDNCSFEPDYVLTRDQIKLVINFFHNYKKGNQTKIPKLNF